MIGLITKNLGWKALSLAAAVLLWISVSSEPELVRFVSAPVEYKDIPDDLEISSDVVESVYLKLRGPSGQLSEFGSSRAAVVLDMSRVKRSGEQTFSISGSNVNLPRDLHLVSAMPSQLRFRFERRVMRSVPVETRFSGGPVKGYELLGFSVAPPSLTIEGPESRVASVRNAVADAIDLTAVSRDTEFRVNTHVDDPHVRFQSPSQVVVKVTVQKR